MDLQDLGELNSQELPPSLRRAVQRVEIVEEAWLPPGKSGSHTCKSPARCYNVTPQHLKPKASPA